MTRPSSVKNDGHPQGTAGEPSLNEQLALEELDVLAIARTIIRVVPAVHHAPMLLVRDGLDRGVHTLVDAGQGLPEVRGQADRLWLGLVDGTLGWQPLAEAHPSGCRLRHFVGNR